MNKKFNFHNSYEDREVKRKKATDTAGSVTKAVDASEAMWENITEWLEDVAQMTGHITYNDVKLVTDENIKRLQKERRRWMRANEEYEDEELDELLETIGLATKAILHPKANDQITKYEYLYLFPELDEEDIAVAENRFYLTFLGVNEFNDEVNWVIAGDKKYIERYARNYLDYELHPEYLYKTDEFEGSIEPLMKAEDNETESKYGAELIGANDTSDTHPGVEYRKEILSNIRKSGLTLHRDGKAIRAEGTIEQWERYFELSTWMDGLIPEYENGAQYVEEGKVTGWLYETTAIID